MIAAPQPLLEDAEVTEWERQSTLFVSLWFTKEQKNEWFAAGKEVLDHIDAYAEGVRNRGNEEEKTQFINRMLALIISAQVDVLEKVWKDWAPQRLVKVYDFID